MDGASRESADVVMGAHLGRKIVGRAAQRPDRRRAVLREAEICDLDVTVVVQENVFGFEISINDVF